MRARGAILAIAGLVVTGTIVWVLFFALPRWTAPKPGAPPPPPAATAAAPTPKIRARLYYLATDGLRLQTADREVSFGEGTVEQARHLIEALLEPAPEPLMSIIPAGTRLRTLYLSAQGIAFVDLSSEVTRGSGGVLDEIFVVYSVVNTLTDNLPAIAAVQVLVDGREVDTLSGHVDLRRPLVRAARWTEAPSAAAPAP